MSEVGDSGTALFCWLVQVLGAAPTVALAESALFVGVVAVYRFARRDGLPQTADRTTWLWIASPAMVVTFPGIDFAFAYAGVAVAMATVTRAGWSALALCTAIAMRPEALVAWPSLAWAWWAYRDGDALDRMVVAAVPPAVFAATIFGGVLGADPAALFAGSGGWRHSLQWHGFAAHSSELIVAALLLAALAVMARSADESPRGWVGINLLVWLVMAAHDPLTSAIAWAPFAIPFYVQLARVTDDPALERAVLAASIAVLTLS